MADDYLRQLDETAKLKTALNQSKQIIQRMSNDYETLKQIHEESKIIT